MKTTKSDGCLAKRRSNLQSKETREKKVLREFLLLLFLSQKARVFEEKIQQT